VHHSDLTIIRHEIRCSSGSSRLWSHFPRSIITVIADGSATIISGIDPSDVAAIPDPELLGPPVGIADSVQTISYDAAAETSSVLALVTAATDPQTTVIASPAQTDSPSNLAADKRSYIGSNTNIHRRDTKYPIDTKPFVSIFICLESS
jgi:hypothetical protein